MPNPKSTVEPNMEMAFGWWSELPEKWTPLGWKHHLFRFNVLFNGMLSAVPDLSPRKLHQGAGVQLGFHPAPEPEFPDPMCNARDNGSVLQRWSDGDAPVLWSEWARDGLVLRQGVFAHIPGGKAIQTGSEPLFAWVRLSVHALVEGIALPHSYGFNIKINAPHVRPVSMSIRHNIAVQPEISAYPSRLHPETDEYDPVAGYRILEEDDRVRLGIAPGQECAVRFLDKQPTERDCLVYLQIPVRKGAHVDLLVPMLPTDREVFSRELMLGYDKALAEANCYWAERPLTAAHFQTPEEHINNATKHNLRFAEVAAETNRATGYTSMLSCSWSDTVLWATPASLTYIMLLDAMGYHDLVEKYIGMFKAEQGKTTPPGDYFQSHPGSLTTPRSLTAIDWITDHGALLWMISEHALITGDKAFIEDWTPVVIKACQFTQYARQITEHTGALGVLPPARATDAGSEIQTVWADGWHYKGLSTAVRLLKRIGHPRAGEFAAEADAYKQAFSEALRKAAEGMPAWTDARGERHRVVPYSVSGRETNPFRHGFYLDAGPLFLVFSGLMDADDELMRSALLWFREGPPRKVYRYDSDCWQIASLHHEMSSCEPCYSWNVFHSHQLGDRAKFLEGMYSLFAGQISRQTYTACETRGGTTGTTWGYLPVYLARLAVVDDQVKEDELHLLRMMPLAWLRTDREARFEKMPTEFGPVSLRARLAEDGKELRVSFAPNFHHEPKRVLLHIPPVGGLSSVVVNGSDLRWDGDAEHVSLG